MAITTNKYVSIILWPLIFISKWMAKNHPVLFLKIRFLKKFKRLPNLDVPRDLNEKILWQKLYADTSKWSQLADKYQVREYLQEKGLSKYLVRLYGVWDSTEAIDFKVLPDRLIFKVNNGDGFGTNKIVKNLQFENKVKLKSLLDSWLSRKNVGLLSVEPHYKFIKPLIIAEELLELPADSKTLIDYKIWCINGKPLYIWVCSDRDKDGGGADVMTYDLDWNAHPEFSIFTKEYRKGKIIPKPINLQEMLELAASLSEGFPILRVDLYNIEGKIYFGELTFTSQGGLMDFYTPEFLNLLGEKADISNISKIK